MKWIKTILRHAAIASGNFRTLFRNAEIPALSSAVNQLIHEINKPAPDTDRLVDLIAAEPSIAAKVIQTVNSALFALRVPVSDIRRAVTVLGIKHVRSLALAYGTMDALPSPKRSVFDHHSFWTDSLLRAFFARAFTGLSHPTRSEEAFTASLLADVALPVLLSVWSEYYQPVVEQWQESEGRLSEIEWNHFGWNHAQAGAWITKHWGFPDECVCCIGAHNFSVETIVKEHLEDTIVLPMAVASLLPSALRPNPQRAQAAFHLATDHLHFSRETFLECITSIQDSFDDILTLFDLPEHRAEPVFDVLRKAAEIPQPGEDS